MRYRFFFLLILLLTSHAAPAISQSGEIDSLLSVLGRQKQDNDRVNTLTALCTAYRTRNYLKSEEYGLRAVALADVLKQPRARAKAYTALGLIQTELRKNDLAGENLAAGLKSAREARDEITVAQALKGLGRVEQNIGDKKQAFSFIVKALEAARKTGDQPTISSMLIEYGIGHRSFGRYDTATVIFTDALTISNKVGDKSGMGYAANMLGDMLRRGGTPEEAEPYFRRSIALFEELGDLAGLGDAQYLLGSVFLNRGEHEQALVQFNRSLATFERLGDESGQAIVLTYSGHIHNVEGRYAQALGTYGRGLTLNEKLGNKSSMIGSLLSIGSIEFQQSRYAQAMTTFQRSLRLCEELDNRVLMASAVLHIGRIHMMQGRDEQALVYYERGKKLFEEIDDGGGASVALKFIADIYTRQGKYEQALRYYEKGRLQFEEEGEKWLFGQALNSIGVIHTKLERYPEARAAFDHSLKLRREINEQAGIAEVLTNISILHLKQARYDSALTLGLESYRIAEDIGAIAQLKTAAKTLSDVYALKHDYSHAYEYHRKFVVYNDSLINQANIRSINEMTAKYEAEAQEQKIALLEKDKVLQNLELSRQQEELLRQQLLSGQNQQLLILMGKEKEIQELSLANTNVALEKQRIENEQKNNELSLLMKDRQLQASRLERETYTRNAIIAGMIVLLIVTGLLLHRYRYRKRTSEQLSTTLKELRQTQAQLIHSEKMVTLGEMTAGMAHEIKNPLNFVTNFSHVAHDMLTDLEQAPDEAARAEIFSDLRQNLSRIQEHGRRADSIVQGMMLHARGGVGESILTDINTLVDDAVNFAYHGIRATHVSFDVTLIKEYHPTPLELTVSAQEISRVLLNLLNNAMHAVRQIASGAQSAGVSGNGDDPSYQAVDTQTPTIWISTGTENGNVVIRVRDNGKGIPEDLQQKIFQPFFTTKPSGEGTGLGLSISYDIIVNGHGGTLSCNSRPGDGAEFVITLPSPTQTTKV